MTEINPQSSYNPTIKYPKTMKNKGIFVKTYGCQMNEYDSKKMIELLNKSHGLVQVHHEDEADVVLMNTCSVREKAQEKVFTQLGQWNKWKNKKSNRYICVAGCVASQEGKLIRKRAPYVDIVLGPQTLHRFPMLFQQTLEKSGRSRTLSMDISFPEIEKFDNLPQAVADGVSAYVSIMEGCSKYCSFCVVPYTRGEEFSRSYESIINEVQHLADQGVREITLLGQNVNAYQFQSKDSELYDFATLLADVSKVEGINRLRYTTSHPLEMTDSLIDCHATIPELAKQIHLPVQSGSDFILSGMKRGYTALEYKHIIKKLRRACPEIELSSDFIIGFPGETEKDFQDTFELVKEIGFSRSFSFLYSARPGTPAAQIADEFTLQEKKERLYRLQELLTEQSQNSAKELLGTTQTVLVERLSRNNTCDVAGRIDNSLIVNFPGSIELIGEFVEVTITEVCTNSLKAKPNHL